MRRPACRIRYADDLTFPAAAPHRSREIVARRRLGGALLEIGLGLVLLGIGWLIWLIFTCQKGQTPAKKLLGMRMVSVETAARCKGG